MGNSAKSGASKFTLHTVSAAHDTIGATAVFTGTLIEQTAFDRQEDSSWKINMTQIQDDTILDTFLKTYAPVSDSSGGEEAVLETGTKVGGSTSASPDLLLTSYGPTIAEGTEVRRLFSAIIKVENTSGSRVQAYGKYSRPAMSMLSQIVLAALNIETSLVASLVSLTPALTLPANSKGDFYYQPTT